MTLPREKVFKKEIQTIKKKKLIVFTIYKYVSQYQAMREKTKKNLETSNKFRIQEAQCT